MSTTTPIIIMGAGISGLALAQGLLKLDVPFHVYERDSALNVRAQGYRVRISGNGIEALKQLLTPELYSRLEDSMAITTTPGFKPEIYLNALTCKPLDLNFPGRPSISLPLSKVQPLNADRSVLRMVLSKGIEDHITFSKEFSSYTITPSGVKAQFTDGTSVTGSLLVGADGKSSRVRSQLLPDHKNIDTEGRWFFGKTIITPSLLSDLNPDVASQMSLVQDRTSSIPKSLLLEPVRFKDNKYRSELPADYIYWVIGCRKDALNTPDSVLLTSSHQDSAQRVLKLTENWDPSIKALFEHQEINQTSCLQIDTAKPDLPIWESVANVTLIGDAIHAISPTAGIGAVTALRSAATLFKVLEKDGISKESLRKYEDEMREFANSAIRSAFTGGKIMFGMKSIEELAGEQEVGK
jgi:2-polyprenyl-6-methoxyphenol hydroxylase-like FAD-dependent oxidoreductase